ncbi:hypothetical protein CDAR_539061 [Caerostris darwini]|uniref:Uncharacterized protein n=1 Tax=Caerostris darwini TaxID=1538125 RepID=A0AAV4SZS3_9ARAC|nr:hypothetical protein CDAR_539061 [Caerostris darwini]
MREVANLMARMASSFLFRPLSRVQGGKPSGGQARRDHPAVARAVAETGHPHHTEQLHASRPLPFHDPCLSQERTPLPPSKLSAAPSFNFRYASAPQTGLCRLNPPSPGDKFDQNSGRYLFSSSAKRMQSYFASLCCKLEISRELPAWEMDCLLNGGRVRCGQDETN